MALVFERIQADGIAGLSYLVGDDSESVAAVFDPRPDVDCYLELARKKQVSITHIFETHIHAALVSGARELVGSAKIFVSHEGGVLQRASVPGWHGMAAVKSLARIVAPAS